MTTGNLSSFCTDTLPGNARFPAWRAGIGSLFEVARPRGAPEDNFHARVEARLLNKQVILASCHTSAQRFERDAVRLARDGLDYYVVQTHLSGSQELWRGGSLNVSGCGDLMVIDLAERHLANTSDFSHLSLVIPRSLLAPLLRAPDSQQGRVLKPQHALTALAVHHLMMLGECMGTLSAEEEAAIIEPTLKLIAGALNGVVDSVEDGRDSIAKSLLARAKRVIERNLTQAFTVENLCLTLGVSRSRLYPLFEPFGGIRAYVQDRRLVHCAQDLLSPRLAHLRIHEIAYQWGFSHEAHFSRAFKQKFGISPRDARSAGLALSDEAPVSLTSELGYAHWIENVLIRL